MAKEKRRVLPGTVKVFLFVCVFLCFRRELYSTVALLVGRCLGHFVRSSKHGGHAFVDPSHTPLSTY